MQEVATGDVRAGVRAPRQASARTSKNPDEFAIVAVDTHADTHAAVVLSLRGQLLDAKRFPATPAATPAYLSGPPPSGRSKRRRAHRADTTIDRPTSPAPPRRAGRARRQGEPVGRGQDRLGPAGVLTDRFE
jgi:hypothetical protein